MGHRVFVRALGDITVSSITSKEDLGGFSSFSFGDGFNHPRGPQGLVMVCQGPPREMLTGSTDHLNSGLVVMETVLMLIPPIEERKK